MPRSASIFDVLHRRTFRYLFVGVTFSRVGDAMMIIVISWIALGIGGPRAVGLVIFAGGCVGPLSAPLIGYLLDKLGLRLLLLVDNLTRGTLMLGLATVVHLGHVRLEYLMVFAVLSGLLMPATELGQNIAVPILLESSELDAANRLLASSWEIAASFGPACAGVALSLIGSAAVLFVDAGTFFVMALVALAMPGRPDPSEKHETDALGGTVSQLFSGFRVLWQLRPVAILAIVGAANLFLGGMMEVFLPAFNKLTLHQGPAQYGLLVSLAGVACLCGTLFLSPIATRLGYGPGLVVVLGVRGLAVLPLAFVGSWGLAAVFVAIAALPDGGFAPLSYSIQQRLIPAHVRGRVQGAKAILSVAGWPLGSAVGGLLFSSIGAHPVAALMAIGYLPLAAAVLLTPKLMNYSVASPDASSALVVGAGESYPNSIAPRADISEDIQGHIVADPYRWLEDITDSRTGEWLAAQDSLYAEHLATLHGREKFAQRLLELYGVGAVSLPTWRDDRWFGTKRGVGQEHAVLYTATSVGSPRVLVDPVLIDATGHTTLDGWQPDHEGRMLAYLLSERGTEESSLWIMDAHTGRHLDGPIDRTRHSQVAWLPGGQAFYYMRRLTAPEVTAGPEAHGYRVFLHQVGSPTDSDVLIFGEGRDRTNLYGVTVSANGRWLIISASCGAAPRNDVWIADLSCSSPTAPNFLAVQNGADSQTDARIGRDGRLYLLTDLHAPRRRLAVADPIRPTFESWTDLVPEDDTAVLTGYAVIDGDELIRPVLLASWMRHAVSEITVHDLVTGKLLCDLPLPGHGTVRGFAEHPSGRCEGWFSYVDFMTPETVFSYDALTRTVSNWTQPEQPRIADLATRQIEYQSADGISIRMLVISGANHDSGQQSQADHEPKPTILHGYGGFQRSLTPDYSPAVLAWVERGGQYVIAGLRGGGEEGQDWHRAGRRERKQNTFDDFHAAAERLIADGWTTAAQLCISGTSNGGLLVGAAVTQRPELFAAALCGAPLLDMVRYERYGLGQLWVDEYGTAADPVQLSWLLAYSPYHRVQAGIAYPAVLFSIFDGDTRVDPMHARKMCAALQNATTAAVADRPILLRRESDVGHGVRAVSRAAALSSETLAFAAAHTGLCL